MLKRAANEIGEDVLFGQDDGDGTVLMGSVELPQGDDVPEWVQLLPAGPLVQTFDGRGPYRQVNPAAIVAASVALMGERPLPIDENHSTDLARPSGQPSPARGWFTAFELRDDGVYGKVEWTKTGRELVGERAYRGVSPVLGVDPKTKEVLSIKRASLINVPNLRGLNALNGESDMDLLKKLAQKLGLNDGVSEEAALAAVDSLKANVDTLNGQVASIAKAAGAADGASVDVVLGAVTELGKRPTSANAANEALQAELNTAIERINQLEGAGVRKAAETFVDKAIADKVAGVAARRDELISMHMEDPAKTEQLVAGFPRLGPSNTRQDPPKKSGEAEELNAEQRQIADQLGIDHKQFAKDLAAQSAT